jgi:hypothetical protein
MLATASLTCKGRALDAQTVGASNSRTRSARDRIDIFMAFSSTNGKSGNADPDGDEVPAWDDGVD